MVLLGDAEAEVDGSDLPFAGTFAETLPLVCGSVTSAGELDAFVTRIPR